MDNNEVLAALRGEIARLNQRIEDTNERISATNKRGDTTNEWMLEAANLVVALTAAIAVVGTLVLHALAA